MNWLNSQIHLTINNTVILFTMQSFGSPRGQAFYYLLFIAITLGLLICYTISLIPYTHDGYNIVSGLLPASDSKPTDQYYNSSITLNTRADEDPERLCALDPDCPWSFICVDGVCTKGCVNNRDCVKPQYCGDNGKCMVRYPPWHPGGDPMCLDRWEKCWFTAQCCSGWCRFITLRPSAVWRCDIWS